MVQENFVCKNIIELNVQYLYCFTSYEGNNYLYFLHCNFCSVIFLLKKKKKGLHDAYDILWYFNAGEELKTSQSLKKNINTYLYSLTSACLQKEDFFQTNYFMSTCVLVILAA